MFNPLFPLCLNQACFSNKIHSFPYIRGVNLRNWGKNTQREQCIFFLNREFLSTKTACYPCQGMSYESGNQHVCNCPLNSRYLITTYIDSACFTQPPR